MTGTSQEVYVPEKSRLTGWHVPAHCVFLTEGGVFFLFCCFFGGREGGGRRKGREEEGREGRRKVCSEYLEQTDNLEATGKNSH